MKILLDENLPKQLKADFGPGLEVKTVREKGWSGKKNGELLKLIVFSGFDFFVTIDRNLRYQQNLERIELKIAHCWLSIIAERLYKYLLKK